MKTVHSIVLFCRDTELSRGWYEKLGFAYLRGYEGMHWFKLGESELMIHPAEGSAEGQVPVIHAGVENVVLLFEKTKKLGLDPFDHQQEGKTLEGPVTRPWGAREFELRDPDGHRWAFTEV